MLDLNLFYPLIFISLIIVVFILSRVYNDKLNFKKDIHFKNKDVEVTSEAFKRIGEVTKGTPNEIILNLQNVENNKEIHNHDKKIEELEEKVDFLIKNNADLLAKYEVLKNKFNSLVQVVGREE